MKSLKDMAKSLQVVVDFMEGREKADLKDLMEEQNQLLKTKVSN